MKKNLFIVCCLLYLLTGCVQTGPLYTPPPQAEAPYATLVMFRFKGFAGAGIKRPFYVDNNFVVELYTEGYTHLRVREGTHLIGGGPKSIRAPFKISMEGGKTYYYSDNYEVTGVLPIPGVSTTVYFQDTRATHSREEAEKELKLYHYKAPAIEQVD